MGDRLQAAPVAGRSRRPDAGEVRGQALDLDLVWSKLRLASMSDLHDDLEDIMISTRHHIYILRPYTRSPPRSIFLVIDRATTKLGMVRRALAECTGE